ncbi:MAG: glycoside hydrolase [Ignavibacteria bacterium GWC2_36_12]|nr:MAG: glycoside hydrolase [Ignavibacteria bacterium GWC2_36_12]
MKIKTSKTGIFFLSFYFLTLLVSIEMLADSPSKVRQTELFTKNWQFFLGDIPNGQSQDLNDSEWRTLNLPYDWSIEGEFSKDNPATIGGGALPGGIGWYRKTFTIPESDKDRLIFIDFDGVYRDSEVWINDHYLGKRPYGYSSFRYELTPFLKYGDERNVLAVKVDNSQQPNSRWYSGSGIYRNVWLVTTHKIYVDHWGTFITTPEVTEQSATVNIKIKIRNSERQDQQVTIKTVVVDKNGNNITDVSSEHSILQNEKFETHQNLIISEPILWSIENPNLYKAITIVEHNGKVCDAYETTFGIRSFYFDVDKGFFLNGEPVKIKGVCNHHDLGCLGAAVNTRAIQRQLDILKEMGVNGIRTSHNPPAPELLDLCDEMGFIVMDEAFDMWKKGKTKYDYSLDWDDWHKKDLEDMVLRDRNHPCIFVWSIGNEVVEQWDKEDSSGTVIAKELVSIVKNLDTTRPITANCNDQDTLNPVIRSGALDLIGYSYAHNNYHLFPEVYPGKKFIASETTSALATRGHYDMPSDTIRRWPPRWDLPLLDGNLDNTCSSYDNCSAPWGSTHEETWKIIKKHDFLSGMYIWTGFDYLGEPTPYPWPSRSSYFGIVDLAGFPKDAYYMYQSEWTDKPVLHVFPSWNWKEGDTIDVWAYTNCYEVELFLNDKSVGRKKKTGDDLHLMWRLPFTPGTLKAVGYADGKEIITSVQKTAGTPARIVLEADRNIITADGRDLSFITVKVLDKNNILVRYADNLISFEISGEGNIVGVDNGLQTSHESFKMNYRKAFNGMCLVVIQSSEKAGRITLETISEELKGASLEIETK